MNTTFLNRCFRKNIFRAITIPFWGSLRQSPFIVRPFSSQNPSNPTKSNSLHKGSRILDIITPKSNLNHGGRQTHLRLIQDILQTTVFKYGSQQDQRETLSSKFDEDPISVLFSLNKEGTRADPIVISQALSFCACAKSVSIGIQLHCLAIKAGVFINVYIGSSLITVYGKSGELSNANKVFDEMPVRNVVSWTALISSFAQGGHVDICLQLYQRMRNSTKPNNLTLTSLLSACSNTGCSGQGRSGHCQAIQMGFVSYLDVSNVLISMYCKFGDFKNAFFVFENMETKDIVSWSSMITGYAQHGLAIEALDLFEAMKKEGVKPDAITFLGVLSSCRHMGFVEQGQFLFDSMAEFGLEPDMDHYSCIVDLLARTGNLKKALNFIKNMPIKPNAVIWGSLLSSCRLYGDIWIGIEAAKNKLVLDPNCGVTHLQLVKLYATVGCWDEVARVRRFMKDRGLKTDPGYSWIEVKDGIHIFRAEDSLNSRMNEIIAVVDCLVDHMRNLSSVFEIYELESDVLYTEML